MGKTYRNIRNAYRKPRGHRKALQLHLDGVVRVKAVPPSERDDIVVSGPVESKAYNSAVSMLRRGFHKDRVISRLVRKWRITAVEAQELLDWAEAKV